MKALVISGIACCLSFSAFAQNEGPVLVLMDELKSEMSPKWEAHVRWREGGMLLATITPWPYQEAFELWYDQPKLTERLKALCPKSDDRIWAMLGPDQDIVLEPTVGGKSGVEARLSCRKAEEAVR